MLFPLTHEDMTARRMPIATIVILLVCSVVLPLTWMGEAAATPRLSAALVQAQDYFDAHPYQRPCPLLERVRLRRPTASAAETAATPVLSVPDPNDPGPDAICADLDEAAHALPAFRFGYIPAENNALGLVTHQFLHGGLLHLVFNMWFLWLCGCNLEDKWGRLVFVPFYLVAGVVAALAHKLANPTSMMPMVGASGAIAGAMGAFLVSYARTRIRFVYWLFLRPGTFTAPAYVMLPLWLVTQVLWGLVDAGDGVAYWAHVGGFVFGLGFGGVLRATGWERKLDEAVEATVSRVQDGRLVEAGDMISAGRVPEAIALLEKLAAEKPASVDVQLEMARAARAAGDVARIVRTQMRLVDLYFSSNMVDTAIEVYGEVQAAHQEEQLPRAWRASTADRFVFVGRPDRADALWSSLLRSGITDAIAVRVALAKARLLLQGGRHAEARDLVEAARACPACEGELAVAAAAVLAQLPPPH